MFHLQKFVVKRTRASVEGLGSQAGFSKERKQKPRIAALRAGSRPQAQKLLLVT